MSLTLSERFGILIDICAVIKEAAIPTLIAIYAKPSLLLHPYVLRQLFFANVWNYMSDGVDQAGKETKDILLPRASGVVLDLGAGHGHTAKYLDKDKVTTYIALEPNTTMHPKIRETALASGFTASQIQLITCGAEDTAGIVKALGGSKVDTITSILVLCGVPDVKNTLIGLTRDVLRPGGTLLFYEHVKCDPSPKLAWWQTFWTPIWQPIFGCRLDKPTHTIIEELDVWKSREVWAKEGETPSLFWHRVGCYITNE